jgi:hypothetical protein
MCQAVKNNDRAPSLGYLILNEAEGIPGDEDSAHYAYFEHASFKIAFIPLIVETTPLL